MTDFNYKNYSLEKLEEWVHDALSCGDASPHEIYSVVRKVVQDEYNYHKEQSQKCLGLLELLSGHRPVSFDDLENQDKILSCDKNDPSPECKGAWNDFWENVDENNSREYNLREAEYYNKRAELDISNSSSNYEKSKYYYDYTRNDLNRKNPFSDKVVKWQLPVEVDEVTEEYFVSFPEDLLEAANLKEGDQVEWVDRGDGSYLLRKV